MASRFLQGLMEALVLVLVVLSPWPFGSAFPLFEAVLFFGVALLLVLWGLRMLLEWKLLWVNSPVGLCLAGLFLLGVWQVTPLPAGILKVVSPGTVALNQQLLPEHSEQVPGEANTAASVGNDWLEAGSAISLYPGGTQSLLLRILAVMALFFVVRSCLSSPGSLQRLAIVALVNGFLLALFALVQRFSSSAINEVYWTYRLKPEVFGPMYRNSFACYLNLSIGLGMGLILGEMFSRRRSLGDSLRAVFNDPARLWAGAALILMLAAQGMSLSRGGVLSLLGAAGVCCSLVLVSTGRFSRLGLVPVMGGLGLALVAWFGWDAVAERFSTLTERETFEQGRWDFWARTFPWIFRFPIWGTGYETFPYLEQLTRPPGPSGDYFCERAHNEYLDLLLEGGVVGLALGLSALVLTLVRGYQGLVRRNLPEERAVALGALFAFTTLALHNVVDFGLHIPAIALLATVLAAQLTALADPSPSPTAAPKRANHLTRTLGCLLGVTATLLVAFVLGYSGYVLGLADRYRRAALLYKESTEPEEQQKRIAYMNEVVALLPHDASKRTELAMAYASGYETLLAKASQQRDPSSLAQENKRLQKEYLWPGLRHAVRARNLCPLSLYPHIEILLHHQAFQRTEPVAVHLKRARLVAPYNPTVWLFSGLHFLDHGSQEQGLKYLRGSLERGDQELPTIVQRSLQILTPQEVANQIVPDKVEMVLDAANLLKEQGEDVQRPFWIKALRLLEAHQGPLNTGMLARKAELHQQLDQPKQAILAYEQLVRQVPNRTSYRYQLARLLHEQGRLQEARRELRTILQAKPKYRAAQDLYNTVVRQLAEGT